MVTVGLRRICVEQQARETVAAAAVLCLGRRAGNNPVSRKQVASPGISLSTFRQIRQQ